MARTSYDDLDSPDEPRPRMREIGFFNWLNVTLRRYIGPPPVGPFDKPAVVSTEGAICPLCGALMTEHVIDRSGPRTQMHCPPQGAKGAASEA